MKLNNLLQKLPEMLQILNDSGAIKVCVHNINSSDIVEEGSCPFPLLLYGNIADIVNVELALEDCLECKVNLRQEPLDRTTPSCFARAAIELPADNIKAGQALLSIFNQGSGYGTHKPPFYSINDIEFDDAKKLVFKKKLNI